MRNRIYGLVAVAVLLSSCTSSFIKLDFVPKETDVRQFGLTESRNFYLAAEIGDSLSLKWSNSTKGGYRNGSIVAADKYIFVSDLAGRIYCFSIENGKVKGYVDYKGIINGSPVIMRNLLVYASAPRNRDYTDLVFYDLAIAREMDATEIEGKVVTELLLTESGVVVINNEGRIYKYGYRGEKLFENKTGHITVSNLLSRGDEIILLSDGGEVVFIDAKSGITLRSCKVSGESLNNGVISGDVIYFTDYGGIFYGFDIKQRKTILSRVMKDKFRMTPAADDRTIYIGGLSGKMYAINKERFEPEWETDFEGVLNATPLVLREKIIVPDLNRAMYFIDKETGDVLKKIEYEERVKLTPLYYKGMLFIGTDDGIINAYEVK
ncbi:MAG: PQQ-binding-like beta-propeller repeat protein [Ignavibacteriaceae bacterium]